MSSPDGRPNRTTCGPTRPLRTRSSRPGSASRSATSAYPTRALSFDLVNEPPALGLRGFTRDAHEAVIRRTVAAIRTISPDRALVIDGLDGGHLAMPELADLGLTQSVRGATNPCGVSHYEAPWWPGHVGMQEPAYPCNYDGHWWDRAGLREFYQPWRDLEAQSVPVHVGEFGCYERTPDDVAQAWFARPVRRVQGVRLGLRPLGVRGPRSASSGTLDQEPSSKRKTASWSTADCLT